jgi:hypothetical protein
MADSANNPGTILFRGGRSPYGIRYRGPSRQQTCGHAHLKRILRLDRLRLRGPYGARDEFLLAASAQNLRKLARLIPEPTPAVAS